MLKFDLVKLLIEVNLSEAKHIRNVNKISGSSDIAYSLIITVLKSIFPDINSTLIKDSITDDNKDASFDVIYENNENKSVDIIDVKKGEDFSYNEIKILRDNIKDYIFNHQQSLKGLSKIVIPKIQRARQLIRSKHYKLNIYIVRNGLKLPSKPTERLLTELKSEFKKIGDIHYLNSDRIIGGIINFHDNKSFTWKIDIAGKKNLIDPENILMNYKGKLSSVFALIPLSKIARLANDFESQKLDLFNKNVREFQKNKGLSSRIIETIENFPTKFYQYHNGLTFSCKEIIKDFRYKFTIIDPQVINGCQTVNTIYQYSKDPNTNKFLVNSFILCKFYSLKEDSIERVCEATNTQLKISLSDLRSNDEIQKLIEVLFKNRSIVYKRKKSSSRTKIISMDNLAQWIYACIYGKPADAKNIKSRLFEVTPPGVYKQIFDINKLSMEILERIVEIGLSVRRFIRSVPPSNRVFEKDADLHFMAALYYIRNSRGDDQIKLEKIKRIIKRVINLLRKQYGDDYSNNKIFTKNPETWIMIRRRLST